MKSRSTGSRVWLIAFEFTPFPGGQGTYASEMTLALRRFGKEVMVVCPQYESPPPTVESASFQANRVFEHQKLDMRALCAASFALAAYRRGDLVLACDIRAALITTLIPWIPDSSRVVMYHGGEVLHAENSLLGRIATRLAAGRNARLVANSNYSANLVAKHTGRDCFGIPLGVSSYWRDSADGNFDNKVLAAIPVETKLVCLVGRLERRKGHLIAIEIARLLKDSVSLNWRLVIAGRAEDPDYSKEVESLCDATENCLYVGELTRDDVRRLYSRSTVLLLPAQQELNHIEGFGLVILEAAAQGCPAVTTFVGGIPDAVKLNETGFLFRQGDTPGMAGAISSLLHDDVLAETMSESAKCFAASCTWDDVCERTFAERSN